MSENNPTGEFQSDSVRNYDTKLRHSDNDPTSIAAGSMNKPNNGGNPLAARTGDVRNHGKEVPGLLGSKAINQKRFGGAMAWKPSPGGATSAHKSICKVL